MKNYKNFLILYFVLLSIGIAQMSFAVPCYRYGNTTIRAGSHIQQWMGTFWQTTAISCTLSFDPSCSVYYSVLAQSYETLCPDEIIEQKNDEIIEQKNLEENVKFLEENKKREGVKILPSGLQYEIIKEGTGKIPQLTDRVTTHYRGKLLDGTEFDSSYERNQPAIFATNGVIQGWQEALQLMKEGAKWKLFIPPELAYGKSGRPGIPPNSVLIFDIELISVETVPVDGKYIPYSNGTVLDITTNLMWMRCIISNPLKHGNIWNGSTCDYTIKDMIIFDNEQVKNIKYNFAGYADWRVPTIKELLSLADCKNGELRFSKINCSSGDCIQFCEYDRNYRYNLPFNERRLFISKIFLSNDDFLIRSFESSFISVDGYFIDFYNALYSLTENPQEVRLVRGWNPDISVPQPNYRRYSSSSNSNSDDEWNKAWEGVRRESMQKLDDTIDGLREQIIERWQ